MEEKRAELKQLEEDNQKLKAQLSEVENPDFLNQEAKRLFGLSNGGTPEEKDLSSSSQLPEAQNQLLTPNWQKWLNLFGF